jgi:hypothetical protein
MRLLLLLLALIAPAGHAASEQAWTGNYTYTESGGRTAGGTGIVVTHELAIHEDGGRLRADLTANGYQTGVELFATAEIVGSRLVIRFERDGEGQVFKGRHKPGDVLLELERKTPRQLLTHWRAYTPATRERFANPGVYFRRDAATRR